MSDEPPTFRTKSGKVLTDADIEALADEAERGYDVEHLLPKKIELSDAFASFAAAIEIREDLIEQLIDRFVELWHESSSELSLIEFIGLTQEQYAAYVEQRYDDLPS